MTTDNLNIRIDPVTKIQAEAIFASFGLTVSDAVNVFLHKSIMERGYRSRSNNRNITLKRNRQ
ncbi:MAG: type II toxin-antitoxin system RelB/DinJ family antitoxin [Bacteroidales bacterium]|nr:type II toxin-antitoxin system RelB/DinJ family antitoxin [Bacteroidales bacterium]